nr:hypothetical protein Itr_chr13CG14630 [Ipomoea trifida]
MVATTALERRTEMGSFCSGGDGIVTERRPSPVLVSFFLSQWRSPIPAATQLPLPLFSSSERRTRAAVDGGGALAWFPSSTDGSAARPMA